LSESESERESQRGSGAEVELSTGSVDATTVQKKQRVEEWKLTPSYSSHDKPTKKHFCGVPGINGSIVMFIGGGEVSTCFQFVHGV